MFLVNRKHGFEGSEDDDEAGHVMGSISCRYFFFFLFFHIQADAISLLLSFVCTFSTTYTGFWGVGGGGGNGLLFLFLLYISLSTSEYTEYLYIKYITRKTPDSSNERKTLLSTFMRVWYSTSVNKKGYSSKRKNVED